jgi:hypothetical protein
MNELGPHSRALLDEARHADDVEMMAARERVRGALGRKLGVAAVGIAATTAGTAGAGTTASIGAGFLAKAAIGLAALGITAGGIAVSKQAAKPKPLPPAVTIAAPRVALPPPVVAETNVVAPPPPVATVAPEPPKPVAVPTPKVVAAKPEPIIEPAPVVVAKPSINDELAAIKRANDAIVGGRPSEALVILDTTPASPTLSEERAGLRLLATCALGHAGASDSARSFLATHPSSPLAARLKSTCSIP